MKTDIGHNGCCRTGRSRFQIRVREAIKYVGRRHFSVMGQSNITRIPEETECGDKSND